MASRNREQRTTLVIEPSKRAAVVGALQTLRKHPGAVSISNIDNHGNLSIVAKNAASLDKLLDIVDAASRAAAARGRAAAAAAAGRGRGFAAGGPSDAGRGGGAGRGQWVGEGRGGGRGRGGKVREEGRSDHAWISELSAGTEGPELTTPSLLLCLIDMGYLAGYYEARYQPETGLGFVQSLLAVASCFSQLSEIESVAESLKSGSAVSLASPRFVMTPKLLAEWTGLLKAQRTEKAAVEEALRLVESFSFAVGAEALHRVPLCFCLTGPWSVLGSAAAPFFERATFYCLGEALVTPGPLVGAEKPPVFIPIRDCLPPHFNEAPRLRAGFQLS
ncbi:MAG: hypothetical protein Q8P67_16800, partial [archaeon]|nr:hypothetical protein [archaeon]